MSVPRLNRRSFVHAGLVGSFGLFGSAGLAGCGSQATPGKASDAGPRVTLTNCGRKLRLTTPERVVSTYPAMTELMIALGLQDRLAGQINTNLSPPDAAFKAEFEKVEVLSEGEPSLEVLLSAKPDFLLADGPYHFDGKRLPTLEELGELDINVYINQQFCDGKKLEGRVDQAYGTLRDLGLLFDVETRARKLIETARDELSAVRSKVEKRQQVKAVIVSLYEKSLYVDAGGLYTDVLELAGGENLTLQSELPEGEYYGQVSPETVARKNPEAIVFTYLDESSRKSAESELRSMFADVSAVRNERLIPTPESSFSGNLRSFHGVTTLAEALHPDAF